MEGLAEYAMYVYQGGIPISNEVMMRISATRVVRYYLTLRSTTMHISVPAAKLLYKFINTKGRR